MNGLDLSAKIRERAPVRSRATSGWLRDSSKGSFIVLYRIRVPNVKRPGAEKHHWYADFMVDGTLKELRTYGTSKKLALIRARNWARSKKVQLIVSKW